MTTMLMKQNIDHEKYRNVLNMKILVITQSKDGSVTQLDGNCRLH